jgi:flagellar motor switch protein FliN/FliY
VNLFNSSVQSQFEVLASQIQARLFKGHPGDARVSWGDESVDRASSDLIWWSWTLSIDSAWRVLAGAPLATWREICGLDAEATPADFDAESLAPFTPIIQEAAQIRFGSEVTCGAAQRAEEPPGEWTSISFAIEPAPGGGMQVHFSISPDVETALGGSATNLEGSEGKDLAPRLAAARNSADILMHVEMPVTIILGCTTMRLKDLLNLTNGSVVELDQMLDEEVEVRVNNCVIAYGEVVAVDGNYAVRILRMAPAGNAPDLRGNLPEKAA